MFNFRVVSFFLAFVISQATAENGIDAWLRYAPLNASDPAVASLITQIPQRVIVLNATSTSPIFAAGQELFKACQGVFNRTVDIVYAVDNCSSVFTANSTPAKTIVIGTVTAFNHFCSNSSNTINTSLLVPDGYLWQLPASASSPTLVLGQNEPGTLYGTFAYLAELAQGNNPIRTASNITTATDYKTHISNPVAPVRWVNQWDNLDGSIERGYGGHSLFFSGGRVVSDLHRAAAYARLLASVGINAVVVNNVNADAALVHTPANIEGLGRIADAFRPYGVRVGVSLNFAAPQSVGGLKTYDPLDAGVISFWDSVTAQLYSRIPDLAGFLVKGDSEGQPGPKKYNRSLAQGANLFAKALRKYSPADRPGVLMYRAFVYDQLQESNWKADRANAAVSYFAPLDGQFDDNVVVQVKYGPIDFQVREPASPLFGHLQKTNAAIELQVTQEYLGQQCHLVYLPPLWRTVLDFDMEAGGTPSPVKDIITGTRFQRTLGGSAGVVNAGTSDTWLGSHLAQANLYAYGRMAWDPTGANETDPASPRSIIESWAKLTFGRDPAVVNTVTDLAMAAWPAYENYTGNLGMQTLTDILYTHFGPNPASQDGNGWGQWTRADGHGVGMDRTVSNGTGFAGQYVGKDVAAKFESLATTPRDLLLWFHHVPYTQLLPGENTTVIQHIYDAHYAGAETAASFVTRWAALNGSGLVDPDRYASIANQLAFQAGHAIVWRDAICTFFADLSKIPDQHGRVGRHPWRIEAEAMTLKGYARQKVSPAITASGGEAVVASGRQASISTTIPSSIPAGVYTLAINYFDLAGGRSKYSVQINDKTVGSWAGNAEDVFGKATSTHLDGHSAMRVSFPGVQIAAGDTVTVLGTPDGAEQAPLDYLSLLPASVVD
ncbi:hypothetical protein SEUCBS139899_008966 [Sporothrix eucalyptigena]|uniref:Alpha-glucuronidase n=1 Tax=Sporothrix eucalyptigena TaxID=1812306 RepID=A0ABP0C118_9PEZI